MNLTTHPHPRRGWWRRLFGTALLAGALAIPAGSAFAVDSAPTLRSASSSQMASEAETVYFSLVNKDVARTSNFDDNWKFNLGDASGAEAVTYNDSKWTQVTLPHDYSIDQDYSQSMEAESAYKPGGVGWYRKTFTVDAALKGKRVQVNFDGVYNNATIYLNGKKLAFHPYGYSPFAVDLTDSVKFGEQNVIAVKVDHKTPSSRFYSGSGIYRHVTLSVTDAVHVARYGTKVEAGKLATEAAGKTSGNFTTTFKTALKNDSATEAEATVKWIVYPKGGTADQAIATATATATVPANSLKEGITAEATATGAKLWGLDDPTLYTVQTEVTVGGKVVDTYDTTFGYRYTSWDANTGFALNGEKVKLQGVCMHHDQGALGSIANAAAVSRQVRILKDMGVNAIRVTHNPASQELIDACEEQGVLLVEEIFDGWSLSKNGNTYDFATYFNKTIKESGDNTKLVFDNSTLDDTKTWAEFSLKETVKRGYNSPSIIMWSLGNEMSEGSSRRFTAQEATDIVTNLTTWAHETDATRQPTDGDNRLRGNGMEYNPQLLHEKGGVIGLNYVTSWSGTTYSALHKAHPDWLLYGSETASAVNSRGIYSTRASQGFTADKQLTSYDTSAVGWGATASSAWYDVITNDYVAGEFVWTGFDYLGEPTPANGIGSGAVGTWPSPKNSYFGIVDTAGLPKDSYYLYQSQWNTKVHTLHVLPAWNQNVVKADNGKVPVVVYTDAAGVKLKLTKADGTVQDLGSKMFTKKTTDAGYTYQIYEGDGKSNNADKNLYLTWDVVWEKGTLTAVALDENGNEIDTSDTAVWKGRQSVTTTGAANKLTASVDRAEISADGQDLSYVTVDVRDADGNIVPDAANNVKFKVEGAGVLAGVDNGSSPDHQSYRDDNRNAFSGSLVGIIRSTDKAGKITVTVSAKGLQGATVTIDTKAVETGEAPAEAQVKSVLMARNYYVKTGSELSLPATLPVSYTDGSTKNEAVAWDAVPEGKLGEAGTFTLNGKVAGRTVAINVTVLDEVAALLNYSAATPVGQAPTLPATRRAVMADGTELEAEFPVTWGEPEAKADGEAAAVAGNDAYDQVGTVTVKGTANVFGKDLEVTATIRVQKETFTLGANLARTAETLTQDVPEDKQSDTLEAVRDGSTTQNSNTGGGKNPSLWSNYDYSQVEGNTTSELTFYWSTNNAIGKASIYFAKDSYSMTWPDANTTELYYSTDGTNWTKIEDAKETIGTAAGNVKPYTYEFTPIQGTHFKVKVKNAAVGPRQDVKPSTGITEIELNQATGSYVTYDTAELASLKVNGKALTAAQLASGEYSTQALTAASLEYEGKENAAVTVLPVNEKQIKLIIQSEDHTKQKTFVINLEATPKADASDDSNDVPLADIVTKTAGSEVADGNVSATEGKVGFAFDNNTNTYFHSSWTATSLDNLWVQMELKEATEVSGLRYLPRNGNGDVTSAKLQYSQDGTTWTDADSATWARSADWKGITLDQPVTAKYFRLKAEGTWADSGTDKFMSAREIRLVKATESTKITDADVTVPTSVSVDYVSADEPVTEIPGLKVTVKGKELIYGVDYKLAFSNNTAVGTATVKVTGINGGVTAYSGEVTKAFEIKQNPARVIGIGVKTQPTKLVYTKGDTFDPTGLVLSVQMSDRTSKDVAYGDDTKGAFTFEPSAFDAAGPATVKVTYTEGSETASAVIDVRVDEASQDGASITPFGTSVRFPANTSDAATALPGLRFGYDFRLPANAVFDNEQSGWYVGTDEVAVKSGKATFVKAANSVTANGVVTSNVVFTEIKAANYKDVIYAKAKLVYTLNGQTHTLEGEVRSDTVAAWAERVTAAPNATQQEKELAAVVKQAADAIK